MLYNRVHSCKPLITRPLPLFQVVDGALRPRSRAFVSGDRDGRGRHVDPGGVQAQPGGRQGVLTRAQPHVQDPAADGAGRCPHAGVPA